MVYLCCRLKLKKQKKMTPKRKEIKIRKKRATQMIKLREVAKGRERNLLSLK